MAKGSDFENEICRLLSMWWTDGERDDVFIRTRISGGMATSRRKSGRNMAFQQGDITFNDPIGKPLIDFWHLELKTGYAAKSKSKAKKLLERGIQQVTVTNWCALDLLDGSAKVPMMLSLWNQCWDESRITNRTPILIFRRNLKRPCIAFTGMYYDELVEYFGSGPARFIRIYHDSSENLLHDGLCVFPLEDFFEWIPNIRPALVKETRDAKETQNQELQKSKRYRTLLF